MKARKTQTMSYLIAAIAGVAFVANPPPSMAAERESAQTSPASGRTKGEVPQTKRLTAIQASARAAAAKWSSKDANAVKQANAQLARVKADLVAYAKSNGLNVTTQIDEHPVGTSAAQLCPAAKAGCVLSKAEVGDNGILYCTYTCVVAVPKGGTKSPN